MARAKRKRKDDPEASDLPQDEQAPAIKMPEGVHHYQEVEEVPWDIQKYWHQGYSIFSKYDDGIWMTDDAWFGVTHESVANTIARHMAEAAPANRPVIIDVFCGVGGNTIAFALSGKWKRVYAIEKDPATLACAKHNAKIYGVEDRITWFQGDCFEILGMVESKNTVPELKTMATHFAVLFGSPPWGGPGYRDAQVFDLEKMDPYSLSQIYDSFSKIARKSSSGQQTQIVHYCTNSSSRAMCAYLGDWKVLDL